MYRNMVTSLLEHERIETTDAKAKEVRRIAERMITLGKRGGLHARRRALRVIRRREVAAKVFDDLAERYRERPGGYTRVLKLRQRRGDAAALSLVELVEGGPLAVEEKPAGKKKVTARKAEAKKTPARKAAAAKKTGKAGSEKKASSKKVPSKKSSSKKTTAKQSTSKKSAGTRETGAKKKTRKKKTD
jgi:large subunit ribosomal protein L17